MIGQTSAGSQVIYLLMSLQRMLLQMSREYKLRQHFPPQNTHTPLLLLLNRFIRLRPYESRGA